jgi:hypothetical protein
MFRHATVNNNSDNSIALIFLPVFLAYIHTSSLCVEELCLLRMLSSFSEIHNVYLPLDK